MPDGICVAVSRANCRIGFRKQAVGSLHHLQDAHERAQLLMPWRINGTLDPTEAALFDAHLDECAECQADLAAETALCAGLAGMPMPELADRSRSGPQPLGTKRRPAGRRRFLSRRVPLGWALAAPAAAAAAALFLAVQVPVRDTGADYRLLGSGETGVPGNVIVMFAPDATERELRATLEQVGGRIVDGPSASGAYMIRVAPAERPAALERLRAASPVVLAEPVDAAGTP